MGCAACVQQRFWVCGPFRGSPGLWASFPVSIPRTQFWKRRFSLGALGGFAVVRSLGWRVASCATVSKALRPILLSYDAHCLTAFALRAACGWLSALRSVSCPSISALTASQHSRTTDGTDCHGSETLTSVLFPPRHSSVTPPRGMGDSPPVYTAEHHTLSF